MFCQVFGRKFQPVFFLRTVLVGNGIISYISGILHLPFVFVLHLLTLVNFFPFAFRKKKKLHRNTIAKAMSSKVYSEMKQKITSNEIWAYKFDLSKTSLEYQVVVHYEYRPTSLTVIIKATGKIL